MNEENINLQENSTTAHFAKCRNIDGFEKQKRKIKLLINIILMIIITVGFFVFLYQTVEGHIVTGMRDYVVMGIYTVNFVFFAGIAYSCIFITFLYRISGTIKDTVLEKLSLVTSFSAIVTSPLFILFCIGRPERIFNLILYPQFQSPVFLDFITVISFFIFCAASIYFASIENFSRQAAQNVVAKVARRKQKFYRIMAVGYINLPQQKLYLNRAIRITKVSILIISVIGLLLLAWLFGDNLQTISQKNIHKIAFVVGCIYAGFAMFNVVLLVYKNFYKQGKQISNESFNSVMRILLIMCVLYVVFFVIDFYSGSFKQLQGAKSEAVFLNFNKYELMYFVANFFAIAPLPLFFILKKQNDYSRAVISLLVLVGLWLKFYLFIVPNFEKPLLPIIDTRSHWISYSATWVEWIVSFSGVAFFMLIIIIVTKALLSTKKVIANSDNQLIRIGFKTLR